VKAISLYLIRHAKSSWKNTSLPDIDRPLNRRGENDAPIMAERLKKRGVTPDIFLSSPARRARRTAGIFAEILHVGEKRIRIVPEIYHEGRTGILRAISELTPNNRTVFLFGHNPDLTDLAVRLSGAKIDNIPTCGIVRIDFDGKDWADISREMGRMVFFDFPKNKEDGFVV